ncbi:amino acid ABC transporter substrate-binding protein [Anaerotignum lactatifermentans]|uniref:Amino acid ABC transporter substrate-binding protein n=1 Tax=Anaerotignum lactatifermentans TaxID=160404 RepID=A0ABS2GDY8_9FIRM|nr:ABC transporter substrate-binding protein [Anaerotignum lactatifermentans]MBM6830244.1 amino acid ABC transporter substrate-binding protein [Anaerotignum lactatifermentans]MBM6878832.1 amino acid ABC transporter substrate-binding protein [Anaerotignum lactatifermentans]MBM6951857.1 amino acid ABC transporter substrate-binding protein [Anaerotignum lactatifermentans]
MKKYLAMAMALVVAFGCAACGSTDSSSETGDTATEYAPTDIEYHSVAAIQERGELKIATEATFAPYAFKDADGNLVGLEVSLVNKIAEDMGVTCVIDDMAFDSVLPSVQSGLDDIAFAALTPTEDRKESFTFTDSYFSNGQMSLVRAEDADKFADESAMVAGVTMGAQKGSYQQTVCETLYPNCTGRYLETVPAMIMDLKASNIDIAIMDYDNAYAYANQNDDLVTAFKVPMLEGDEESNCAAAMKGNDDLVTYINGLIAGYIEDGSMQKWYEEAVLIQQSLVEAE